MITTCLFSIFGKKQDVRAQVAPVKQWHLGIGSTLVDALPGGEDWLYATKATTDGGHISVGYSDKTAAAYLPAILKVNAQGEVIWEKTYLTNAQNWFGKFFDVCEVPGTNEYVAVGWCIQAGGGVQGLVVRIDQDGNLKPNYPKYFDASSLPTLATNYPGDWVVLNSIRPYNTAGAFAGFIIGGSIQKCFGEYPKTKEGGVLIKLNTAGILINTFGAGGWKDYNFANSKAYRGDIFSAIPCNDVSGNCTGFYFTGSTLNSACLINCNDIDDGAGLCNPGAVKSRDVMIGKTDVNGNALFINKYDETDFGIAYSSQETVSTTTCGAPCNNAETNEQRGYRIEQKTNGINEFYVAALFDYQEGCCGYTKQMGDGVIFKIDGSGTFSQIKRISNFSALEFFPGLIIDNPNSTIYFCANKYDGGPPDKIFTSVYKLNLATLVISWTRDYLASANLNCTFDMDQTRDGGLIVVGNIETSGDDYMKIKLAPDCQMNQTYAPNKGLTINSGTTTTWSTNKTVRGTVRIQNGGKLIIKSGAQIYFANSRQTVDFDLLSTNSFNYTTINQPTKIIVEPGGVLEIDGGTGATKTTLQALNACSGNMWEGIEVWGQPALAQTFGAVNTNQGYVNIYNSAVLRDMFKGVTADKTAYPLAFVATKKGSYPSNTNLGGGGVIRTTGNAAATFKNNRISISFGNYSGGALATPLNESQINKTDFICDNFMNDINYISNTGTRLTQEEHIYAEGCNRLRIFDCTFKGWGGTPIHNRGDGIYGLDAGFNMVWTNANTNLNNFAALDTGVYAAYSTNVLYNLRMVGNRFSNCYLGVMTLGGTASHLEANTFNIENVANNSRHGIRTQGATDFHCFSNNFVGYNTLGATTYSIGAIHTGTALTPSTNDHNTYTSLSRGTQTQGNCGNVQTGLTIACNYYTSMQQTAMAISPNIGGSLTTQGLACGITQVQANNAFNDPACPGGISGDHINSNATFTYYGAATGIYHPSCILGSVSNIGCQNSIPPIVWNANSCVNWPPHIITSGDAFAYREMLNTETNPQLKGIIRHSLVDYYLSNDKVDSAIVILETDSTSADGRKALVAAYIGQQQYAKAQYMLNALPPSVPENNCFKTYYQIVLNMAQAALPLRYLSTFNQGIVDSMANSNTCIAVNAQAVMENYFKKNYVRPTEDFGGGTMPTRELLQTHNIETKHFIIVPNPASCVVKFEFENIAELNAPAIQVIDAIGKTVNVIMLSKEDKSISLNTSQLPNGLYTCKLCNGNQTIDVQKLIIAH